MKIPNFVRFMEAVNKATEIGRGQDWGGFAGAQGRRFRSGAPRAPDAPVARPRPAVPLPLPRLRQPSLLVVAVFFTTHNGGGDRRRGPAEHPTPIPTGSIPTQARERQRAVTGD